MTTERCGHPRFYTLLDELALRHDARNAEYATMEHPLQNFEDGARLLGTRPAVYALSLVTKQMLALMEGARKGSLGTERDLDHLIDVAVYALLTLILLEEEDRSATEEEARDLGFIREIIMPPEVGSVSVERGEKLIYLACPYSHPDGNTRQARFEAVCRAAARLMSEGHCVFSPLSHSHPIAEYSGLEPMDHDLWAQQDEALLARCSMLYILTLDGWSDSVGVKREMTYAMHHDIPVHFIAPTEDGT